MISFDLYNTVEREIETLVKLEHPNIINYYDRQIDDFKQYFYLGLAYCEGTLQDVINGNCKNF